jgi:hypothetical protein
MRFPKLCLPGLPGKSDADCESHGVTSAALANAQWHTSSFSGYNGNCVEVSRGGSHVAVRDTKDRERGPVLIFTLAEWGAFLAGAKNGEFDLK